MEMYIYRWIKLRNFIQFCYVVNINAKQQRSNMLPWRAPEPISLLADILLLMKTLWQRNSRQLFNMFKDIHRKP